MELRSQPYSLSPRISYRIAESFDDMLFAAPPNDASTAVPSPRTAETLEALCLLGAVMAEGGVVPQSTTVVFGPSTANACLRWTDSSLDSLRGDAC